MGLLSKLFGSKNSTKNGTPEQEVEVLFEYGSTNFQYVYALGDQIQLAIREAKVGEYDGTPFPPTAVKAATSSTAPTRRPSSR